MVNKNKEFCFRITHIDNLEIILENGIVCKTHLNASPNYINIGNPEIIDVRNGTRVRVAHYGMLGEYVPFYFTPKSIMLYNIQSGFRHPVVAKRPPSEILVMRFRIDELCSLKNRWFFTDGQANDSATNHFHDLSELNSIDWNSIQNSKFSKTDDYDRGRRYQAEFLVKDEVPLDKIESFVVYDEKSKIKVETILKKLGIKITVNINKLYYF